MNLYLARRTESKPHFAAILSSFGSTELKSTDRNVLQLVLEEDDFAREPVTRPPLESIVQGWNVTGDASWLLNFAAVGLEKVWYKYIDVTSTRSPRSADLFQGTL